MAEISGERQVSEGRAVPASVETVVFKERATFVLEVIEVSFALEATMASVALEATMVSTALVVKVAFMAMVQATEAELGATGSVDSLTEVEATMVDVIESMGSLIEAMAIEAESIVAETEDSLFKADSEVETDAAVSMDNLSGASFEVVVEYK